VLKRILDEDERLIFSFSDDLASLVCGQGTEETQHLLGGGLCASALSGCADFAVLPLLPAEKVRSVTMVLGGVWSRRPTHILRISVSTLSFTTNRLNSTSRVCPILNTRQKAWVSCRALQLVILARELWDELRQGGNPYH
jgi:hypothetical protein